MTAPLTPTTASDAELTAELREACVGHPVAKIAWPHRLLHRAADRLDQLSAEVAAKDAEKAKLADPVAVHLNMLRGTIAKPSIQNVAHLYTEVQQMRQALIATLKHFRHPTSAEHETRDKVMAALSHFDEPPLTPMFQALSPRMEADNAG